jgi:hypothetical protein
MTPTAYAFDIDASTRRWNRVFLVHPEICTVRIDDRLTAMFGRWSLSTPLSNIAEVSVTGPYRKWKVAGPPRLSLADGGVTFATTHRRGVCISFVEPVGALDPFGIVRHPNATLTVAEPDRFADDLRSAIEVQRQGTAPATEHVGHRSADVAATASAFVRWIRRQHDGSIDHVQHVVDAIPHPVSPSSDGDVQTLGEGVGPTFHRRYRVVAGGVATSADDASRRVREHLDAALDDHLSPVTKLHGELSSMTVGDRYLISIFGPWNAPIEVAHVDATSFRFATLSGHLEAGVIDFIVSKPGDGDVLEFVIESWARNGDQAIRVLYDVFGVARMLQAELWVGLCERFVELVGGSQVGPVDVLTERCSAE